MNDKIIEQRWHLIKEKLNAFLKWYKKQNKKTQDKIQSVIDSYDIPYNELRKKVSKSDREKLSRHIDEWLDSGMFVGYFKYLTETKLNRNFTYYDLLEILLYSVYENEKKEVNKKAELLFSDVYKNCYQQGMTDLEKNNKKEKSSKEIKVILEDVLVGGITYEDYINAFYLTNMQEIQKRFIIYSQQNKKFSVDSDSLQQIFSKQRNRLISIQNEKYSGGLDKYAVAYGNIAYLNASSGSNALVKFVSDHCENVTEMCSYMDGMIFNTESRNIFKRPMGKTQKDLVIQEIDIYGLVLGINMPPIDEHFHWCHSTLTYQIDKTADELRDIIFEKDFGFIFEDEYFDDFENLDKSIEHLIFYNSKNFKRVGKPIKGNSHNVSPTSFNSLLLSISPKNSLIAVHNHPSNLPFSLKDFQTFNNRKELKGIAVRTDDYIYLLSVGKGAKMRATKANMNFMEKKFKEIEKNLGITQKNPNICHQRNIIFAKEMGWKYGRIRNQK